MCRCVLCVCVCVCVCVLFLGVAKLGFGVGGGVCGCDVVLWGWVGSCGVGSGGTLGCGGISGGRASNVAELDLSGHLDRESSCKGADLLMNIHEKGGGLPAALFLDGEGRNTIEAHGHGTPSS